MKKKKEELDVDFIGGEVKRPKIKEGELVKPVEG
jgi:hypothetical protein